MPAVACGSWGLLHLVASVFPQFFVPMSPRLYQVVDENGEMAGGPMYYLERGLGQKWLGVLFALFGAIASFGIGNTVQANAVSGNLKEALGMALYQPDREREVLILIAQGLSNRDIAEKLVLSEGTIKNHVSNILNKLQAENRTHAVDIARRYGLA